MVTRNKKFKVGDKIINFGQVFRIFKIEEKKIEGRLENILHFKPYYKGTDNTGLVCSIPKRNISQTNIREPISMDRFSELLGLLSKRSNKEAPSSVNDAKEVLNSNDPEQVVDILRALWKVKKRKSDEFTKGKKDALELALKRLIEEFALVGDTTLDEAEVAIRETLP